MVYTAPQPRLGQLDLGIGPFGLGVLRLGAEVAPQRTTARHIVGRRGWVRLPWRDSPPGRSRLEWRRVEFSMSAQATHCGRDGVDGSVVRLGERFPRMQAKDADRLVGEPSKS